MSSKKMPNIFGEIAAPGCAPSTVMTVLLCWLMGAIGRMTTATMATPIVRNMAFASHCKCFGELKRCGVWDETATETATIKNHPAGWLDTIPARFSSLLPLVDLKIKDAFECAAGRGDVNRSRLGTGRYGCLEE